MIAAMFIAMSGFMYWSGDKIERMMAAVILLLGLTVVGAVEAQTIHGPIAATVTRVIDGDTVEVDAQIWPGIVASGVSVRVDGIDTPERRGQCEQERQLAESAKLMMADLFAPGSFVELRNVRNGKFAGRVLADVSGDLAGDWAQTITAAGLAVEYHGKGEKNDWCSIQTN
jgi:endonuclease YncB( thermonuclease family)